LRVSGFCELTLQAADPERAARFYAEAFGLPVLERAPDRVWLGVGERARLGLWSPGAKEFGDRGGLHVHFAFAVPEGALEELPERVRAAGGKVDGPHVHDGGDRSLYVTDPAGNVVEAWDFFDARDTSDLSEHGAAA